MSTPVPGWYPAPDRVGQMRYWDGVQWTDQYQVAASTTRVAEPAQAPDAGQWWPEPAVDSGFASPAGNGSAPVRDYASFAARAGASLVDSIIIFAATFALGATIGTLVYLVYGEIDDEALFVVSDVLSFLIDILLVLFVSWWYFATGWSPGRALVGIRIVDVEGERPGARRGIGRLMMSFVSLVILGVGYLAMLWSPTKQTWHDRAAGTYVVRAR
jgi:uncharacterized RDD family membrane protein YckC